MSHVSHVPALNRGSIEASRIATLTPVRATYPIVCMCVWGWGGGGGRRGGARMCVTERASERVSGWVSEWVCERRCE